MAINGASVHYVDEGQGPPLLLLHGNPTWSFLYREIILGLRDRYRCIAPDYPGFGLSRPAPDYGFTPAEHAGVLEQWLLTLDLSNVTMMVQDWGGRADRPALLTWPTSDVAFRGRERARWESIFPNHRTVVLEGAGHYIQEDAREEIVAAIRAWPDAAGT